MYDTFRRTAGKVRKNRVSELATVLDGSFAGIIPWIAVAVYVAAPGSALHRLHSLFSSAPPYVRIIPLPTLQTIYATTGDWR